MSNYLISVADRVHTLALIGMVVFFIIGLLVSIGLQTSDSAKSEKRTLIKYVFALWSTFITCVLLYIFVPGKSNLQ